ncbi:YggS family pyridoxal phosphate-dependent enzyme [Geopsychrobacter electrodiphilus]|uniref:YggS family pyridoxal phosphate-dependent enzyme n=1 Tax=Geopsychrobacter electrodiphilus TaxID=225196 RepID=UPI00038276FD|nr:YggS family pyridoxal phosphate-dependent enzyme [Geopsychrobacter electrodiphilus]
MSEIAANLSRIREQIKIACQKCGRDPKTVRLVAVSKKKPGQVISEAYAAGQQIFGESYVQEFTQKVEALQLPLEWHFIGGLQGNKVKYLRGKTALIHSVDRYSLAREISSQWGKIDATAQILLQFNLGRETSKSGADETEALDLARKICALPHLQVRGLMTLPPYYDDPEEVRPYFRRLRQLGESLAAENLPNLQMQELSMGMSHDFSVAIEEGATLVRVGTAIFGARD